MQHRSIAGSGAPRANDRWVGCLWAEASAAAIRALVAVVLGALALHVAAAGAPAAGSIDLGKVAWRQRTLANGLQVVAAPSRASPTVSVQVWYHVGSRDDPQGRSGFAHLFEHLMFKSTRYLKAEQFDRLTEDVGGANNAFTTEDVTAYQDVVPSNHLEALLWAEAERMAHLQVEQAAFVSERAVVEEEYRQRVLAQPYGRFFEAATTLPYREHPYRRPTIGSIDDLERGSLADVVDFHARHYRPDNATLVVAGDFDDAQLDAWVDRYFGAMPRPAAPLPRFAAGEPPWPADRRATVTAASVPLPAVAIAWLAPPATSADAAALRVAAAVLSAGESSRLNQSLVYRQRVASQAGVDANLRAGPGLFVAIAIGAGGKKIGALEAALLAEVRRLGRTPPRAAELAKVKTQLVTHALVTRQTPLGLAGALGDAAVLHGDPGYVDAELRDLQRVSAADVQRAMRRYVEGAHRMTIEYRQEGAR